MKVSDRRLAESPCQNIHDDCARCGLDRHLPLLSRAAFLRFAISISAMPLLSIPGVRAAEQTETREVAPGVFVHQGRYELQSPANRGDMSNAACIVGRDAVAVIDTSGSAVMGRALREVIKSITSKPIRYVINTHMHPDHVFGNVAFKEDNPAFVAHHKMARGLLARADRYLAINKDMLGIDAFKGIEIVVPTVGVQDKMELDLGGRTIILEAQKPAHTDNDLIVTDQATNTLFLGDLLFSVHVPTLDGSIRGWLSLIDDLKKRTAARVVPGHGPHTLELPDALTPEQRYLTAIATGIRAILKEGGTLKEATRSVGLSERDAWQLFDEYHVRTVTAAFAELEWE
jgi:quinoprotein relay system zinc metallohydrolase 2